MKTRNRQREHVRHNPGFVVKHLAVVPEVTWTHALPELISDQCCSLNYRDEETCGVVRNCTHYQDFAVVEIGVIQLSRAT